MSLKDDIPMLVEEWKKRKDLLAHNQILLDIFEGNLQDYVLEDLQKQLHPKSYEQAKFRVAPINVLKRLIDKLSKIYSEAPARNLPPEANDRDNELFKFYMDSMDINTMMSMANEFFNLFKTTDLDPYLDDEGYPRLRVNPADRFFVYSDNLINPLKPTHRVLIMGTYRENGKEHTLFHAFTDTEFEAFNEEGKIVAGMTGNFSDGSNPYGQIPGVYVNKSRHFITPPIDTDTLTMSKLVPILLTDLNYAVMFQAFSIVYGIDVDEENLSRSPNSFWRFKSDPASTGNAGSKPQVGVIKPEVDIAQVIELIKSQLVFWMQSRNIKPGAMDGLSPGNVSSGVAKIVDEMDTSEDRKRQVPYFISAEKALWKLVMYRLHPVWSRSPDFQGPKQLFTPGMTVTVDFAEQRPVVDVSTQIDDQIKMISESIQSRLGALKELYPDVDEDDLQARLDEIDADRAKNPPPLPMPSIPGLPPQQGQGQEPPTAVVPPDNLQNPKQQKKQQQGAKA